MPARMARRSFFKFAGAGAAVIVLPVLKGGGSESVLLGLARAQTASSGYFTRFGVTDSTLRRIMERALSRGGDYCDIFLEHSIYNYTGLQDGQVDRAYGNVDLGAGIRVLKGDAAGYAYSEDLSEASLLSAAETAATVADASAHVEAPPLAAVRVEDYYPIRVPWESVGIDKKLPLLEKVDGWVRAADQRVIRVTVFAGDEDRHVLIANSDGVIVEDSRPMAAMWLTVVAKDGERIEANSASAGGRMGLEFYSDERLRGLVDRNLSILRRMFETVPPPIGEIPVVLAGGTSGIILHEAIGHGMEADSNRKGVSIYADRINKRIAPDPVTILDDATQPNSRGSLNVDDECVPGQKTVLVENGILRSYMHDRISARHYRVKQTGSGRRQSFRFPPYPRMRDTYMIAGRHDPNEIIASVKNGLYAEDFTNGEVRIGAGDFTFYLKIGALIENGKLTHPVKDANLAGNGPKVLETMDMVGHDFGMHPGMWNCGKEGQYLAVSHGQPTVRAGAITVGGRRA